MAVQAKDEQQSTGLGCADAMHGEDFPICDRLRAGGPAQVLRQLTPPPNPPPTPNPIQIPFQLPINCQPNHPTSPPIHQPTPSLKPPPTPPSTPRPTQLPTLPPIQCYPIAYASAHPTANQTARARSWPAASSQATGSSRSTGSRAKVFLTWALF